MEGRKNFESYPKGECWTFGPNYLERQHMLKRNRKLSPRDGTTETSSGNWLTLRSTCPGAHLEAPGEWAGAWGSGLLLLSTLIGRWEHNQRQWRNQESVPCPSAVWSCTKAFWCVLREAKFPLLTTRPENSEHAHTFNTFTFRSTFMHPKPPLTCGGCHLPEETTPCPHFQTACSNNILRQRSGSPENSSGLTHRQACMSRSCGTSTGTGRSPEQAGEMLA